MRLLGYQGVREKVTISRSTMSESVRRREFPPLLQLANINRNVWLEAEIDLYIQALLAGKTGAELRQAVAEIVAARAKFPEQYRLAQESHHQQPGVKARKGVSAAPAVAP